MKALQKICVGLLFVIGGVGLNCAWAEGVPVIDENQDGSPAASNAPSSAEVVDIAGSDTNDQRDALPLQQRVKLLEQQLSNITQMNLPAKIDALQQQVQQLSGQLEVQAHAIQVLTDQQHGAAPASAAVTTTTTATTGGAMGAVGIDAAANKPKPTPKAAAVPAATKNANNKSGVAAAPQADAADSDTAKQIAQAESNVTRNARAAPNAAAGATAAANPAAEQQAYQKALDLLTKKQNDNATVAFQAFVKAYPRGTYAPNAHYWLGQLYSLQGKSAQAGTEFSVLITKFPNNNKVPDAMLKLAIIHDDAGQHAQALQELQKIVQKFPDSNAAKMASARLNQ